MKTGDIIKFGKYKWCVLDVQGEIALLISNYIIERSEYYRDYIEPQEFEATVITWESSTIRKYLNGAFYNSLLRFGSLNTMRSSSNRTQSTFWTMNIHAEVYANSVFGKRLAGYAKQLAGNMELLDKKVMSKIPHSSKSLGNRPSQDLQWSF